MQLSYFCQVSNSRSLMSLLCRLLLLPPLLSPLYILLLLFSLLLAYILTLQRSNTTCHPCAWVVAISCVGCAGLLLFRITTHFTTNYLCPEMSSLRHGHIAPLRPSLGAAAHIRPACGAEGTLYGESPTLHVQFLLDFHNSRPKAAS